MNTKNSVTVFFLALLCTVTASGQPRLVMKATIPFEFSVESGKTLPAGTYAFTFEEARRAVVLSGGASNKSVILPVITRMGGQAPFGDANLVFDDSGGVPLISEIWLPRRDGILLHSMKGDHRHRSVLAVVSGGDATGSGNEVFAKTCARCHGSQGRGNETADRFFNTTIPRLASQTVQAKSDAELKEIVTQGRRTMDPVRVDQSGVRHLLPLEAVDAVIAYIRTLKQ